MKESEERSSNIDEQKARIRQRYKGIDPEAVSYTHLVLDTSIHYICTNNLKLSSCLRLSNNINSKYHLDNIKILLSYPRARSTCV